MKLRLASCRGTPLPPCDAFHQLAPTCTHEEALKGRHAVDRIALPAVQLESARERLWTYQIFAPARMEARVCTPDGRVAEGATIVQRIFVGPTAIETAVRVTATWHEGFEYITLPGHPELGVARFSLTETHFEIESWSRPGTWLTALGAPFSRWMQQRSTQDALQRVSGSLETA